MHVEIALCQIRPAMGDPEYNIQVVTDMITSTGSDVLVFPECFLTNGAYILRNLDDFQLRGLEECLRSDFF